MASMEFRPVGTFASSLFSTQKSARRALRDGVVTASVALFVSEKGCLFVGLTDGKVLLWETDARCQERRKGAAPRVLDEHRGGLRCMLYVPQLCDGVLVTGAADRCIKLWDLSDPRQVPCVHSLHGHGGTVLSLAHGQDMLLSSATDGQLFLWRDQSPVRLLRFPAYGVRQRLSGRTRETWFLSLAVREGEVPRVFAGDSDGFVHVFRAEQELLVVSRERVHELGVHRLLCVPELLFTAGYDQRLKALDPLTLQVVFEERHGCVLSGLGWDGDLAVGDLRGQVGLYNLHTEQWAGWHRAREPVLEVLAFQQRLLVLHAHSLALLDVVKGARLSELHEHTGPIVAMHACGQLLYTAAMDNTIRLWDAEQLECLRRLRDDRDGDRDELTAMAYVAPCNVLVTGHESSELKLWALDAAPAPLRAAGLRVHSNTVSALLAVDCLLVCGSYDRRLSFWRVSLTSDGAATAKLDRAFLAHEPVDDEVLALCHSGAAQAVFSGGNHGRVRAWPLAGGHGREYGGHEAVSCLAADGFLLFVGACDGVTVWEAQRATRMKRVPFVASALLVLPDGLLASCGEGRLSVWELGRGRQEARELRSHEQPEVFRALALLGSTLLVGCESGRILGFPEGPALERSDSPAPSDDGSALELLRLGRLG